MVDLTLQDLENIKALSRPEALKGCAKAYAIATTYFPSLINMAGKYLKTNLVSRVKLSYSSGLTSDGFWCIRCSDGSEERIGRGDESRGVCTRLVDRLNSI